MNLNNVFSTPFENMSITYCSKWCCKHQIWLARDAVPAKAGTQVLGI